MSIMDGKKQCLVVLDINMEARSMIGIIWMCGSIEGGFES